MTFYDGDLENEEWRCLEDFPNYEISNMGRMRTKHREKIGSKGELLINQSKLLQTNRGKENAYSQARIVDKNGNRKAHLVHRLVAETFIPHEPDKNIVNHINGNKKDNRVENLEWCTYSDNNYHAYQCSLKNDCNKVVSINAINGELVDFYYSQADASVKTGIEVNTIGKAIKNQHPVKDLTLMTLKMFKEKYNEEIKQVNKMRSVNKGKEVIMTNKELADLQQKIKNICIDNATILALITLHDQFDFTEEQLSVFLNRYISKSECIAGDYTTWEDQLQILAEECGMHIKIDKQGNMRLEVK